MGPVNLGPNLGCSGGLPPVGVGKALGWRTRHVTVSIRPLGFLRQRTRRPTEAHRGPQRSTEPHGDLASALLLPCVCFAVALVPCYCPATAVLLPCYSPAMALLLPCYCSAIALLLPCHCPAMASLLPCLCHAIALATYTQLTPQTAVPVYYSVVHYDSRQNRC